MDFDIFNFRNAMAILDQRLEWAALRDVINDISRDDIISAQEQIADGKKNAPAGAQQAVNRIFEERMPSPQWIHQSRLFEDTDPLTNKELARWTMDFVKRGPAAPGSPESDFGLGVEVTFNHAEAIAWTLVRLDLASETSVNLQQKARIDVGVAIYASKSLKQWGRMDGAVGTFEQASLWLELMKPVLPIPLVLIGLKPRDSGSAAIWEDPGVFRGTRKG